MTFITELISEEDATRTGIFDEAKRYGGPISRDWAIDRERNIYLHLVGRGREEFMNRSTWLYCWRSQTFKITIDLLEKRGKRGETGWAHLKLINIKGLLEKNEREQFLADLQSALESYKGLGVHAIHPEYTVVLEA